MTDKYRKWVKWNKEQHKPIPPMTGNQASFADWLLENAEKELEKMGDLSSIFESVRRFIKEENKNKDV